MLDLVQAFGRARRALEATAEEIAEITDIDAESAVRWRRGFLEADADRERERAAREGIEILLAGDAGYPPSLGFIDEPPVALYVRGSLAPEDAVAIAIVGSRRASPYGRAQARRLSRDLAGIGAVVVSGLARGIDAEAHRGALEADGRTLAILGSGANVVYPPEHRSLRDAIAKSGAVVTEFPLDAPPLAHHFPRRNRLVSGLSLGVIVVEAAVRSGSLVTVDWALSQGREVFAVPGPVDSPLSTGAHRLLREGATLAESVDDVARAVPAVEALLAPLRATRSIALDQETASLSGLRLEPRETRLLHLLTTRPMPLDAIVEETGYPASLLAAILTTLELKGLAERVPGEGFVRRR